MRQAVPPITLAVTNVFANIVFVAAIITQLVANADRRAKLFPVGQIDFRRQWWAALENMGIRKRWPPHSLRHSGPAHRVARGQPLEEVRRRGRWISRKSVQRYTKVHV